MPGTAAERKFFAVPTVPVAATVPASQQIRPTRLNLKTRKPENQRLPNPRRTHRPDQQPACICEQPARVCPQPTCAFQQPSRRLLATPALLPAAEAQAPATPRAATRSRSTRQQPECTCQQLSRKRQQQCAQAGCTTAQTSNARVLNSSDIMSEFQPSRRPEAGEREQNLPEQPLSGCRRAAEASRRDARKLPRISW